MPMRPRTRASLCALAVATAWWLAPELTAEQAQPAGETVQAWKVPRTPWGDPDFQGFWTNVNEALTPLERLVEFGERLFLTDEEWKAREEVNEKEWRGRERPVETGVASRRASRIIDPPNGRFPPMTEGGKKRQAAMNEARNLMRGPEDAPLYSRCLTRGILSMLPTFSNMYYQIVQSPGHAAILYEQIRDARIIPLDGRPHVGEDIQLWMGDPRGRWEGDTLVVETTNFRDGALDAGFIASDALHVVERFTRVSPNEIEWQATVTDPKIYTKPITVALPLRTENAGDQVFEYACHEGNYNMEGALRGSRAREAAEAAK